MSLNFKVGKAVLGGLLMVLFYAPVGVGQVPVAAGYTPEFKAHLGYAYTNVSIPSEDRLITTGVDGGFTVDLKPRFGAEVDLMYTRNYHAYGTQYAANLFTYLGGPVFYARRGRKLDVYVHGLLGGGLESGVNFDPNENLLHGYVNKLAWAAGGGAEYRLDRSLSLRVGADYLKTAFFTPAIAIAGQHDFRATIGLSYKFGGRRP